MAIPHSRHMGARDRRGCREGGAVTLLPGKRRGARASTRKRGRHVTRRGPLPWKRGAGAPGWGSGPGARATRQGHGLLPGHNAVRQNVGPPWNPGRGCAAEASGPGWPRSRDPGAGGQHQLVACGRRLQRQAPGPPPGPIRRAPGERRRRGLPLLSLR